MPRDAVTVRVQNGWVTLEGKVEWQYQRNAAASAIRDLAGVVGISNLIAVAPRPTSSDVKRRIEDAFRRDAELEAQAIQVNVLDGKVTLDGTVKRCSSGRPPNTPPGRLQA